MFTSFVSIKQNCFFKVAHFYYFMMILIPVPASNGYIKLDLTLKLFFACGSILKTHTADYRNSRYETSLC